MKSKLFLLNMLFIVSISYSQLFVASDQDVFISSGSFLSTKEVSIVNNGEFISDNVLNSSQAGEVILNAAVNQTMSGPGNYENLRIDNTAGSTVNVSHTDSTDPIDVNGLLTVDGNFDAGSGNFFRLPCIFPGPNGRNAQIAESTGTISGDVTVQQCIPGRRAFRLVTSSTSGSTIHDEWQENPSAYDDVPRQGFGTHITGLGPVSGSGHTITPAGGDQYQGLDWNASGNPSMFSFDEGSQSWINVENTTVPFTAGQPYLLMVRGSRAVDLITNNSATSDTTLESAGVPEIGSISVSPSITASGDAVLVGNPYHAIVDLLAVNIPSSDYGTFAYIYDPNLGGASDVNTGSTLGGRGGYVTIDLTNANINILGTGSSAVNQYLQPNQAFFVIANSATPANISFDETDKAVVEPQTDVFSSSQSHIFVNLFDQESHNSQNTADDGLVVYFSPNSSNTVDLNDAIKFFNQDEMIARNENGSLVSYENRAMPVEEDVLELYTDQYRTSDYVLEVGVQFLPNQTVYLHDKYTDTEVLLNNNAINTYAFTVDQSNPGSIATDRFEILFQSTTLGTDDFDLQGISVYPNPASEIVNIGLAENVGRFDNIELFDISGRLVAKQAIGNQLEQTQLDVNTFSSGVYVLKVSSTSEQFSTKVIIK